jgi:hypothetical protein
LDGDVPWSEKESEHVLRFNKSPSKKVRMSRKEKQMVLKQVGEVFLKSSKGKGAGQPLVHFDGQYVYIRALSQELLEKIYDSPPELGGVLMQFVSKGYPHPNTSMYKVDRLPTMPQEALQKKISADKNRKFVDIVLSSTYKVRPLEGNSMCSGTLIIFADSQAETFFFLGRYCRKIAEDSLPKLL